VKCKTLRSQWAMLKRSELPSQCNFSISYFSPSSNYIHASSLGCFCQQKKRWNAFSAHQASYNKYLLYLTHLYLSNLVTAGQVSYLPEICNLPPAKYAKSNCRIRWALVNKRTGTSMKRWSVLTQPWGLWLASLTCIKDLNKYTLKKICFVNFIPTLFDRLSIVKHQIV